MKTKLIYASLMLALFSFSNCASIVSKTKYPVLLKTTPAGATVTVTNKKGIDVFSGTTPASIILKSGGGYFQPALYKVKFEMPGYDEKIVTLKATLNGWYIGNIVFGGLIGLLIVDPLTGAMYKINRPMISEKLLGESEKVEIPTLEIYGFNDIPESWKKDLVKIN
jgi:hypothetical protein